MKKITLIFAACIISLSAMAEGYQVNSLSAKQNAMGHVGTAMKIGAESMEQTTWLQMWTAACRPAHMARLWRERERQSVVSKVPCMNHHSSCRNVLK